ncbi:MAG: two-component regulator propeller domain-containing protein [Chitinophagaceae bacterium]
MQSIVHAQSPIKFSLVEGVGEISLGKITGITQDANGYMWFSDQDKSCITRFDGYNMRSYRYDPSNTNGLGGSYPETIYADTKGFIWVGFYGMGLDKFDPRTEKFIHYRYNPENANGLSSDSVNVVAMDRFGHLWIGTNNGLDVLDPQTGVMQHYHHQNNNPGSLDYNVVRSLCIDRQGYVWVGTGIPWENNENGGLNKFDPATKTFKHFLKNQKVRAIFEDSKGQLWIGTNKNKLYSVYKNDDNLILHTIMPEQNASDDHITFIREDGAGMLWIGTYSSGIIRYNPTDNSITHYGDGDGLMDNSAWQAYVSREGVLWFSTQSANLYRVDPTKRPYTFHPAKSGVLGFAESSKDHIWLSTNHGVIYQQPWSKPAFLGLGLETMPSRSTETPVRNQFIKDKTTDQWLLQNGSLYKLDTAKHSLEKILQDTDFIRHAVATDKNHMLLATATGLYKMDLVTLKKEKVPGEGNDVNALYIDKNQNLWIGHGSNNGLTQTDESGEITTWLKGHIINCLYEDNQGAMWVGTPVGAYVKRAGQDNFSILQLKGYPLNSADVNGFAQDDSGYVWISSRSGIFQLNGDGSQTRMYSFSQGINSSVLTGAIFRKQSGEILVGSKAGFYSFDPRNINSESPAPQIVMRELKVAGELLPPVDHASSVTLKYNQNIFSIGFAGIHFSNPGENIHLYKLENYDADWRKAGAERTAYYYNVPPGKYTFRVRVGNNEDVWAEKSLSIEITPAWWSNIYLKVLGVIVLVALLYLLIRRRFRAQMHRQLEKSKTEQQLAELQHRSSELEMQALRAQMNPHFIFNSLNAINRFILQNNSGQASGYLTKFSRLIRFILQNSEQAQISLERELQTLDLYLELEALRFDHHFSYKVSVHPSVDAASIQVPPLIIQPYAENAIWHGLMHKETAGHLEIKIHCDENWLYCIIKDDGIGRRRAGELKSKSANQHKSMGMKITANRMELLKKENPYSSAITINDTIRKDGTAGGTEVILKIPLKYD